MWVALLVSLLFALPLVIAILRSNEICVLVFRGGRLDLQRGRIPHQLFDEIEDILQRARVPHVRLRLVVESRQARVNADHELGDATLQRLRNVVGRFPLARIRAGLKRAVRRR